MKRIFMSLVMAFMAVAMYAQKDVTTFLGIPVDGYKSAMKQKLISKGFVPKKLGNTEYLQGEFNGINVNVHIVTNNNKVYRIMLSDAIQQDEANIKIRFNKLVSQFKNNKRYVSFGDYTLSDSEDISYEMLVHNKKYEAAFYQVPDEHKIDTTAIFGSIRDELLTKYSLEQIKNPTEEITKEIQEKLNQRWLDILYKKLVWFSICESYGEYYIAMYYDNEYNHANGEDL